MEIRILLTQMLRRALEFQNHPQRFIDNWVDNLGFDTCHRTQGYNVDKCHKDCQKLEKSNFAKKCARDGGLFKCCIRLIHIFKQNFTLIKVNFLEGGTRSIATTAGTAAPCQSAHLRRDLNLNLPTHHFLRPRKGALCRRHQMRIMDFLQTRECTKVMTFDV